jgi:DNA-binding LytR/AlgR family response regulator
VKSEGRPVKVKIAICDDEPAEIGYLSLKTREWAKNNDIELTVLSFANAEDFLLNYTNINPDILLLDIQMPGLTGVELAVKIRGEYKNETMQIIFITGYADYISLGYEVAALHYLMKPVKEEKLFEVLDRALKKLRKTEKSIIFSSTGGENIPVFMGEIMSIESFAHYLEIKLLQNTKIRVKTPLNEIERTLHELGGQFIRCHRSYIAGLKHIKKITKTDVILDDGSAVPVSRRLYNDVNQAVIKFFMEDRV